MLEIQDVRSLMLELGTFGGQCIAHDGAASGARLPDPELQGYVTEGRAGSGGWARDLTLG